MKFKLISCFFLIGLFFKLEAQSPNTIVGYFKKKEVNNILKNSAPTVDLIVGSQYDTIFDSNERLQIVLQKLFAESYFDDLLKGKIIKSNLSQITYMRRSYNNKGKLESESTLTFYFKKINGKYKLYKLVLAG